MTRKQNGLWEEKGQELGRGGRARRWAAGGESEGVGHQSPAGNRKHGRSSVFGVTGRDN